MQSSLTKEIFRYQYSLSVENLILDILVEKHSSSVSKVTRNLPPHTHPFLEIFVCKKDCIALNSPEGLHYLHAGEAAIVPPLLPHCCLMEHDESVWSALMFSFKRRPSQEGQDVYNIVEPYIASKNIICFRNEPELITCVQNITQNDNDNQGIIRGLQLLSLLCRLSHEHCFVPSTERTSLPNSDSDLLRLSHLDYIINTEFMRKITAAEMAQRLHISPRQLARIVTKRYNATLHQVITKKRIGTAAYMLQNGTIPAEKIAEMVGYSSKTGFWREFQKMYGMTPIEYRNNFKN